MTEKVSGLLSGLGRKATTLDAKYNLTGKASGAVGAALDGVAGAADAATAASTSAAPATGGAAAAPGKQPGGAGGPTAI